MTLLAYSCLAVPLWCAFFALYFILRSRKLFQQSLIAKCAGSFLAVGSAGFALYAKGEFPLAQGVFWAFVLCALADAVLELSFVPGMAVFAGGHVLLILWLWSVSPAAWWNYAIWAVLIVLALVLFYQELPRMGWMAVPSCLYVALLAGTLAMALPLPFTGFPGLWPAALGAVCFFASDMILAKNEFNGQRERNQKSIMALYWAALYFLAAALW